MRPLLLFLLAALSLSAQSGFYRFSVDQDRLSGAPDFSFLNHPLGPADRIFVRDGHFYRVGPDGRSGTADDERVRFFGMNLAFGGNFPTEEDAPRIAKRLRRLGVNLVRLHHMDSSPDRDPANAGSSLTTGPYPTLNPVAVARLRRFLDAMKAEGIWVNLNLHVGYAFRPEVDKIPAMPGGEAIPKQSKPLHIFYPRMVELQLEYTRKLIDALRLKGDPVLAMAEIDNESSLVDAWMKGQIERYVLGDYRAELERQWHAWRKGEAAPLVGSKDAANPLIDDYLLFLADRDRSYLDRMLAAVRESAGAVPVAGTQMGFGGLLNLDSHAGLDYQDHHFYIDHYNFPHQSWDSRDWRMRDSSSVGSGFSVILNVAVAREAGRPYTVSEFNQPWPNRQAAELDPTLAAFGAFQDWDAVVHFAYSHGRSWENPVPSGFDLNSDWTKWPNIGQSAFLFRTAVSSGKAPVAVPVSRAMRLEFTKARRMSQIAPFLKAAGFDPAVALQHPVAIERREGGELPRTAASAPYRADTGELAYDEANKLFTVAAPQAAGAFGFVGTRKVTAGAIDVELAPSARGFASILLTALDNRPIGKSRRLLLSNPGYTLATLPKTDPPRMQKLVPYPDAAGWLTIEPDTAGRPSGSRNGGIAPVWMERIENRITLRTAAKRLTVYPLDAAGTRLRPIAPERLADGFRIHLQADGQDFAPWYEVVAQ